MPARSPASTPSAHAIVKTPRRLTCISRPRLVLLWPPQQLKYSGSGPARQPLLARDRSMVKRDLRVAPTVGSVGGPSILSDWLKRVTTPAMPLYESETQIDRGLPIP